MCMNHPTFEVVTTLEKFFETFSIPSCNASSFVMRLCKTCVSFPSIVNNELMKIVLNAPDTQLSRPWRDHLEKLWNERNSS